MRHEGHRRYFTEADFIDIQIIVALRNKGLSLQSVRKIIKGLRRLVSRDSRYAELSNYLLVTNGKTARITTNLDVADACKSFPSMVIVIQLPGTANGRGGSQKVPAGSKAKSRKI